jgi:Arc/MetJ-type ribon-helix-helix transcriptional regulator
MLRIWRPLNVKVENETKEKTERLVQTKGYKNKSEALRKIIEERFRDHPELLAVDDLAEVVREASEISDRELDRLTAEVFTERKTAAELVGEGREMKE